MGSWPCSTPRGGPSMPPETSERRCGPWASTSGRGSTPARWSGGGATAAASAGTTAPGAWGGPTPVRSLCLGPSPVSSSAPTSPWSLGARRRSRASRASGSSSSSPRPERGGSLTPELSATPPGPADHVPALPRRHRSAVPGPHGGRVVAEGAEAGFLVAGLRRGLTRERSNQIDQPTEVGRLADVGRDPQPHGPLLVLLRIEGRDHHNRGQVGPALQAVQHTPAIEHGHHQVEEDQIGLLQVELLQSDLAVLSQRGVEPEGAQAGLEQVADRRVVVDDQDLGGHGTPSGLSPWSGYRPWSPPG